jgi:hypothetical protein
MLESRSIMATLSGETLEVSATRICPRGEGRVIAPSVLINGKFLQTVSAVLQTSLGPVERWCDRRDLSINPRKTVVIPFTKN